MIGDLELGFIDNLKSTIYNPEAEGEGFEPTMDFSIPVFKTGALSHSAIPP